jgi:hypothetical protein
VQLVFRAGIDFEGVLLPAELEGHPAEDREVLPPCFPPGFNKLM